MGKTGKDIISVLLLLVAGIGAIISYIIAFITYIGFSHPFTLAGGVLALLGGIMVMVSKDE